MQSDQHSTSNDSASVTHIHDVVRHVLGSLNAAPDSSCIVAVSGGPDSLCLADAVISLATQLRIRPVIAHLNHSLRGAESDADAAFVTAYAIAQGVHLCIEVVDVQELAYTRRVSVEVAARTARYEFLQHVAHQVGAGFVLVAHNADDQVETVLLRVIRGTGMYGLRGMQGVTKLTTVPTPCDPPILLVRPLLTIYRTEIEQYCLERSLQPRLDHTNFEPHYMRNRIRLELLPLLEKFNPGIRKVLLHLAETASTDMEVVDYATKEAYAGILLSESQAEVTINRTAWQTLPIGIQRTVLRHAIMQLRSNLSDLKFAGIEEARDVLNSAADTGQIAILAEVRILVSHHYFTVILTTAQQQPAAGA